MQPKHILFELQCLKQKSVYCTSWNESKISRWVCTLTCLLAFTWKCSQSLKRNIARFVSLCTIPVPHCQYSCTPRICMFLICQSSSNFISVYTLVYICLMERNRAVKSSCSFKSTLLWFVVESGSLDSCRYGTDTGISMLQIIGVWFCVCFFPLDITY